MFCPRLFPRLSPGKSRASWIAITAPDAYLQRMFKAFEFCLPTNATKVPAGPEWLHEIKQDGFRIRVERDGDRIPEHRRIQVRRLAVVA